MGCVTGAVVRDGPRAPDEGGSPWIAVETPHFALATDMEKAHTWLQRLVGGSQQSGSADIEPAEPRILPLS